MGHLVNRTEGLSGSHGIGYDYVLGSDGVYVQSENGDLTARVQVAGCEVRGLAPLAEKVELAHGPIPALLFETGLRWFRDDPRTERFFAVRWDGEAYRAAVPLQEGTASFLEYRPATGAVAEFHSHGTLPAFFSKTDDEDEQGFRIYGVAGRLDAPEPELSLRIGVYGHFAPLEWPQVFDGPQRNVRLVSGGRESTRETSSNKEVSANALLP